ncbi:hypothetical protein DDQ68_04485 [Hymenobacter nivis]|uniref:Uncharacterized protein n=1 Tax=Hymenobacter nivis TaxID=1850093 RepID=A0A2Z3GMG2_9BACT|nr:hypothetical protein DDQ68_04485 [Hymenobacter nivis]
MFTKHYPGDDWHRVVAPDPYLPHPYLLAAVPALVVIISTNNFGLLHFLYGGLIALYSLIMLLMHYA